ncbi:WEB family protein At3g02930, chloroplastic-like [Hibiscus syriacus]|uniref:WEB family protein At3g02930, chloroplastic-like n=1 Tax=Hibiscus syriacus TaxID=106335 RepID=UPI0019232F64|nr:WEB family protein At3g02930, chloroplastic-like [Hibiscus syriacus]
MCFKSWEFDILLEIRHFERGNRSAAHTKVSPATPRVPSKLSRVLDKPEPGSPSSLRGTRHSVDRSPRSPLNSKPTVDHSRWSSLNSKLSINRRSTRVEPESLKGARNSVDRSPRSPLNLKPTSGRGSPRFATPSEKSQTRASKGLELQAQFNSVQEDLKKAKEHISLIEKEKAQAIDELKEAHKAAEEANEKLKEALVSQMRAEERLEIEKFRTAKLEQAGIEAAQKKDEEWRNEIESIKNRHAMDVATLCSTIQELERVKQELAMVCDAKNQALNRADDATKIAEIHAEEVGILSAELVRLNSLIGTEHEKEVNENKEMVIKCKDEIESLKQQLETAKAYEEKLMEKEAFIEQLNVDLEAARIAESYALNVVGEWKKRFQELRMHIAEAKTLQISASDSLDLVMRQLESNNNSLLDAKSEITVLKQKAGLLEVTINKQIGDLVKSQQCMNKAKEETKEVKKLVESLKSELKTAMEEKTRALNNEKIAASSVQALLEEKTKLMDQLECSRDEIEKSKKAMESLASVLNQVSAESREAMEKLLSSEKEHEDYETKLEDLRSAPTATNERYETMLGDAKKQIDLLTIAIERSKNECQNGEPKYLKQSDDEADQLKEGLKQVESEVIYLQEALMEVKTESTVLKESLLDKETKLQCVVRENGELQAREADSLKKADELSKLLEEATNCENDYYHGSEENPKLELPSEQPPEADDAEVENANGQVKEFETKRNKEDSDKVEFDMWESCKIENKEFSREREPEKKIPCAGSG